MKTFEHKPNIVSFRLKRIRFGSKFHELHDERILIEEISQRRRLRNLFSLSPKCLSSEKKQREAKDSGREERVSLT